jgi:hypothetical protein
MAQESKKKKKAFAGRLLCKHISSDKNTLMLIIFYEICGLNFADITHNYVPYVKQKFELF